MLSLRSIGGRSSFVCEGGLLRVGVSLGLAGVAPGCRICVCVRVLRDLDSVCILE